MFGRRFITFLQEEILALIREPILAGQNRFIPLEPTEAKPPAFQQQFGKREVKLPLLIPPEDSRLPDLRPSFRVQVKQDGKHTADFLAAFAKLKLDFRMTVQVAKNRADLGAEPRPQFAEIPVPVVRQVNGSAGDFLLRPQLALRF